MLQANVTLILPHIRLKYFSRSCQDGNLRAKLSFNKESSTRVWLFSREYDLAVDQVIPEFLTEHRKEIILQENSARKITASMNSYQLLNKLELLKGFFSSSLSPPLHPPEASELLWL